MDNGIEFELIWSPAALNHLDEIRNYLAATSAQAAIRTLSGIVRTVEILKTFPYIGVQYRPRRRAPYREILYKKYRIYYAVNDERRQVEICPFGRAQGKIPTCRLKPRLNVR